MWLCASEILLAQWNNSKQAPKPKQPVNRDVTNSTVQSGCKWKVRWNNPATVECDDDIWIDNYNQFQNYYKIMWLCKNTIW